MGSGRFAPEILKENNKLIIDYLRLRSQLSKIQFKNESDVVWTSSLSIPLMTKSYLKIENTDDQLNLFTFHAPQTLTISLKLYIHDNYSHYYSTYLLM